MKRAGVTVNKAEIIHWPADMEGRNYSPSQEVKDDLLTGQRAGAFPEYERYSQRK
jgi:hypothetical protein